MQVVQEAVAVPVDGSVTSRVTDSGRVLPGEYHSGVASDEPASVLLTPPIDIHEASDGLVLEADLPGVPDGQVSIHLEANVLQLRGQVAPMCLDGAKVLHEEYRPGIFTRSFILSDEVDRSCITTSLKDGVLQIALPKAERTRTRRIEIRMS